MKVPRIMKKWNEALLTGKVGLRKIVRLATRPYDSADKVSEANPAEKWSKEFVDVLERTGSNMEPPPRLSQK